MNRANAAALAVSGLAAGFSILESSGANAAAAAVAAGSYPITTASGAATVTAVSQGRRWFSTAVLWRGTSRYWA